MQFLLFLVIWTLARNSSAASGALPQRSDSVLVRAVVDGDTIDVATIGRVRLLGIDAPELGRGYDTAGPFAYEARDKLVSLVWHRWVRLEFDSANGVQLDVYKRHLAYVVREDGVFVNAELVRAGLARVSARVPLVRLAELKRAEAEAQSFRRGMWGQTPPVHAPSYTRRTSRAKERRSSWQTFPSNTRRNERSVNATSSITDSTTGRSGFLSSSSRQVR